MYFFVIIAFIAFQGCRSLGGTGVNLAGDVAEATLHTLSHIGHQNQTKESYQEKATNDFATSSSNKSDSDFSLLAGRYIHRSGILRELGNTGPTFGVHANFYWADFSKDLKGGMFVHWSFDHFFDTNSRFLFKPKFWDESYTNYMLASGFALKMNLGPYMSLFSQTGIALNFLEIDTFRTNDAATDQEYTDLTLSVIERFGFNFAFSKPSNKIRFSMGPSLLYYWSPDPLAKFVKDEKERTFNTGGSWALLWEFRWD